MALFWFRQAFLESRRWHGEPQGSSGALDVGDLMAKHRQKAREPNRFWETQKCPQGLRWNSRVGTGHGWRNGECLSLFISSLLISPSLEKKNSLQSILVIWPASPDPAWSSDGEQGRKERFWFWLCFWLWWRQWSRSSFPCSSASHRAHHRNEWILQIEWYRSRSYVGPCSSCNVI